MLSAQFHYLLNILKLQSPLIFAYCVWQFALRLALASYSWQVAEFTPLTFILVMLAGLLIDTVVMCWATLPFVIYYCVTPARWLSKKIAYLFYALFIILLIFSTFAEWIFWDEFAARFNFIAVDYLIYTNEVIGNVRESYPLPLLLTIVGGLSLLIFLTTYRNFIKLPSVIPAYKVRLLSLLVYVILLVPGEMDIGKLLTMGGVNNNYQQEIGKNGWHSLCSAFFSNRLDYSKFYPNLDPTIVNTTLSKLLHTAPSDPLTKAIKPAALEKHYNVIMIVMESMSADFMARFGNQQNITPELDSLAKQSILFTNMYATGTRTVRGLEALALSIPPTPGNSIIRQPGNEQLYSLGKVTQEHGYSNKFIYGGYGYFDNMNYFFAHNNFSNVDRGSLRPEEINFANIWGVCDEDLFNRTLKEADQEQKPFLYMVMTTSNHRPYTYPTGKIDIPAQSGRAGGVKYADYAVGEFIRQAAHKSWFKNTIFVLVADHTAGSAGKVELDQSKYHIPAMIYAPHIVKPREISVMASQIDIPTTILGLLKFNYTSRFYGQDLLGKAPRPRAFISNYQKLGYLTPNNLILLKPLAKPLSYHPNGKAQEVGPETPEVVEAISYLSTAAKWQDNYR